MNGNIFDEPDARAALETGFNEAWDSEMLCEECHEPWLVVHAATCSQYREPQLTGILNVEGVNK